MALFDTQYRKQVQDYLPPAVRSSDHIDWLYSLISAEETAVNDNEEFSDDISLRVKWNGQKMVMQAAINIIMEQPVNTIIIETNQDFSNIAAVIYNDTEPDETAIVGNTNETTMLLINDSEETPAAADFKVLIPVGLSNQDFNEKVESEIQLLKVAGTEFILETY